SSNNKDSCSAKKHLLCCALLLGPVEGVAETYENLVLDNSGYWQDITIDTVSTPNGALLIKNGASINLTNADVTVGLISGVGVS
ncbi:hypothetical protein, partial [Rosenbergiella metrosideri]|uniref:hypothetical protein n=1 Tax=Rosenbergiella metrosideri TaxID=2921185 RepID=UPI001F4FBDDE